MSGAPGQVVWREADLARLAEVLDTECGLFRGLLELARRKQQAILGQDRPALEGVLREELDLLQRLQRAEEERRAMLPGGSKGGTEMALTLAAVADQAADPWNRRLHALRRDMVDTVHELVQAHRVNGQLLVQALGLIEFTLQLISGALPEPTYETPERRSGRSPAAAGRGVFDLRA